MKVLVLTNEFEEEHFGGAGTTVTGITYMLDDLRVKQTVVVPRSDHSHPVRYQRGKNIIVLGVPRNPRYFGHLGMIKPSVLVQEFSEIWQRWDLIYVHAINFATLVHKLSEKSYPVLYTVHSFLREEWGDRKDIGFQQQFKIQEDLLGSCQRIHLISQAQQEYLLKKFPEYLYKAEVVPLGIHLPKEQWEQVSTNRFLYVGRLLPYKGIEDLIKAVEIVIGSGYQMCLDIVGRGADNYEDYLKRLVKLKRLEKHIEFHGWKTSFEVSKWMLKTGGLVIPSWREAFGFVALEGMALGVPIIASTAGGLKELLSSEYALTFEAGNVEELSKTLITALDHPSLLNSYSNRARLQAANYEWSRLGPRYLALLEQAKGIM